MSTIEESGELLTDPINRAIYGEEPDTSLCLRTPNEEWGPLEVKADDFPDATTMYLRYDIRQSRLLTAKEEVELAKRIEVGLFAAKALEHVVLFERTVEDNFEWWEIAGAMPDEIPDDERMQFKTDLRRDLPVIVEEGLAAKALFIQSNVRLVASIAKRHVRPGLPFIDTIQNGNLGLIHAVELFDYAKGYKFSTYATWWIRQAINREYAQQARAIRLPRSQDENVTKIMKLRHKLVGILGEQPSIAELAKASGMSETEMCNILELEKGPISLDMPIGHDSNMCIGDTVPYVEPGYDRAEDRELEEAVQQALGVLTEREAAIIRLRYLVRQAYTKEQVAQVFGVTAERIRQIEVKALGLLRKYGGRLLEFY